MNAKKTNPANREPEMTATQMYAARSHDIARLMASLEMHLEVHANDEKADPANWGHAGDLASVRQKLVGLVAFVAGIREGEVEEFLAEND